MMNILYVWFPASWGPSVVEAIQARNVTCLARKPIVRDPHIFDRKEAASRPEKSTVGYKSGTSKLKVSILSWLPMQELIGLPWMMMTSRRSFPFCLKASCKMCFRRGHLLRGKVPNHKNLRCQCSSQGPVLRQNGETYYNPDALTTRHASLVPVSAEALQRECRQMQAKHLWYNLDIRWVDLKDKLEVLAPTGLTRDDIWRHLFLTKQRKNPYEEGCYTGEDLEDVKRKWEAKKEYISQYKATLLALTWPWHFKALTLTTLQRIMQLKTRKHYMHVDGRQKKVFTVSRGRLCLMYVMHLSTMTMLLLLAQMSNRDGGTGMKTMLRDTNVIPNGAGQGIPYASSWSSTYESFGQLRTSHPFLFTTCLTIQ